MKNTKYSGKDIIALSDREHVRLRTQVYLGSMHPTEYQIPLLTANSLTIKTVEFIPAVYKAIGEIIDNSLDEFSHLTIRNKTLKITADTTKGLYTISDNGRGVPIDKHVTGKHTPEVVFGSLRSGRNFTDDKEVGVIGMNGVGSSCTNYCSTFFEVEINRDGKKYSQRFSDGALTASKPKIVAGGKSSGTTLTFQLDPAVFGNVSLPDELIRNRAIEIAMTNPDLTVEYNGEKFKYKNGMTDFVNQLAVGKTMQTFSFDDGNVQGDIHVVFNGHQRQEEQMFTWVNSSFLFDGGKCNTQFFNAFFDRVIAQLAPAAKKAKAEITRNDVRAGLLVFANLKVKNPEYDSQAKTRLTGPDMRKDIVTVLETTWKVFTRRAKDWFDFVLENANQRHHREADDDAAKEHEKTMRQKKVEGLLDATSRIRSECQILITEGKSANGQISMSRDPKTTAAFALTGKINNVYDSTVAQVLAMGKIKDLLAAIGLVPGKKLVRSDLNFGKIVISTDADYDGDDIFTILVNLFFKFWPGLFDPKYEPIVYRMVAPNVCLVKGDKRIHFARRSDYERVKDKYKGYEVRYYKGLGSMNKLDWDMCLSGQTNTMIPIVDDGHMDEVLSLLFGNDADARKLWLTTPIQS